MPSDVTIKDRSDLQGIVALGTAEAIHCLQKVIQEYLEDAVTRKWKPSVDGVYKGKIVSEKKHVVLVKIGEDTVGVLPKKEIENSESKWLLVQVERRRLGHRTPLLSTQLRIVGKYAILIKSSHGGISLRIQDVNKRAELSRLSAQAASEGWRIIWREPAAFAPQEILEDEVARLRMKAEEMEKLAASTENPALILEGSYFMDVEFPSTAKKELDKLRASVSSTLEGHHFYKSCGSSISSALEMTEKLLENGKCSSEVNEMFRQNVESYFPDEGSIVDVKHVKLSGAIFNLGKAIVEKFASDRLIYSRTIKANGFYDGLNVLKEVGDKAISETVPGEYYIITRYYSKDGVLKGAYVNLNTPIEVYPDAIRYIDLEVDVCVYPDGHFQVVDVDKLERALNRGLISRRLFEKTLKKTKEILENLRVIS